MGYVLLGMLFFAGLIGIAEIFQFVEERWYQRGNTLSEICVLPLEGHIEQVEGIVRAVWRNLYGKRPRMYLCDLGMDAETREICRLLCTEHSNITLCTREQLAEELLPKNFDGI